MKDSLDPRDWSYVRKYTRPKLHFGRVFFCCLLYVIFIIIIYKLSISLFSLPFSIIFVVFIGIFILILFSNRICIWLVKFYQHYAPISIRSMCRYEPSCSEYMILAIEKYGTIKGISKGIKRIYSCSHGGGGFEKP